MIEQEQRALVCEKAREWLGTPYHHNQGLKGVGTDCALFPAAVYAEAGMIDPISPSYTQDWHLHRSREIYVEWVLKCGGIEIPQEQARGGDLALWKWGRAFSHGGILLDETTIIHSYVDIGVTLDNVYQHEELRLRPSRWFTFWVGDNDGRALRTES